jgi:hypothetical protein
MWFLLYLDLLLWLVIIVALCHNVRKHEACCQQLQRREAEHEACCQQLREQLQQSEARRDKWRDKHDTCRWAMGEMYEQLKLLQAERDELKAEHDERKVFRKKMNAQLIARYCS